MNVMLRDIYFNKICASVLVPQKIRPYLYRMGGVKLDKGVTFCPHCFCGNNDLIIGEGTFINYNVWFDTAGGIEIGKNCNIAYQVVFVTSTHELGEAGRRAGDSYAKKIIVGDGVWIGARATILPGVNIGNGVIIAAGAVVTSDCEPNCMYAGVPAKKIKSLVVKG